MKFNLFENNKSIQELIEYIDKKIKLLKTNKTLDPEVLKALHELYVSIIDEWYKHNVIMAVEPDSELENTIQNNLLELITYINRI